MFLITETIFCRSCQNDTRTSLCSSHCKSSVGVMQVCTVQMGVTVASQLKEKKNTQKNLPSVQILHPWPLKGACAKTFKRGIGGSACRLCVTAGLPANDWSIPRRTGRQWASTVGWNTWSRSGRGEGVVGLSDKQVGSLLTYLQRAPKGFPKTGLRLNTALRPCSPPHQCPRPCF